MSYTVLKSTPIQLTAGKDNKPEKGWRLGVSSDAWGLCEENDTQLSMMSYPMDVLPVVMTRSVDPDLDFWSFHNGINLRASIPELQRALKELELV
jgi:hypothetical protein